MSLLFFAAANTIAYTLPHSTIINSASTTAAATKYKIIFEYFHFFILIKKLFKLS